MPLDAVSNRPRTPRARLVDRVQMHPTPDQVSDRELDAFFGHEYDCKGAPIQACVLWHEGPICEECIAENEVQPDEVEE